MAAKLIAVSGATGQQGGSVAKHLMGAGHKVRALTRNTESVASKALAAAGAEVRSTDFTDSHNWERALVGVDAFFLMSTPFESGTDKEAAQGIAAVDTAKRAGVPYIVYSSVGGANTETGIPHFDSKYRIEQHLASSDIPHSVIAPVYFYENVVASYSVPGLKDGRLALALPRDRKLQMISYQTIGSMVALALTNPGKFGGKRLDIAGDELTGTEIAAVLAEAANKEIEYVEVPLDVISAQSEDMGLMFKWFNDVGYSADINLLSSTYPEAKWISFKDWASSVDWTALFA